MSLNYGTTHAPKAWMMAYAPSRGWGRHLQSPLQPLSFVRRRFQRRHPTAEERKPRWICVDAVKEGPGRISQGSVCLVFACVCILHRRPPPPVKERLGALLGPWHI